MTKLLNCDVTRLLSRSRMSSPLSAPIRGQLDPWRDRLVEELDNRTVAVAQEWIGDRAGSEKVFEALAYLLPTADLYALTHEPGCEIETGGRPVRTSFLDRSWLRDRRAVTLPLMPLAWRTLSRRDYDVVVTSSHAFAREFGRRHSDLHLSYVHSPARYLWFPDLDDRTDNAVARWLQRPGRFVLKRIDLASTRCTDALAANSQTTRERIGEVYARDARVIYPPVDTTYYHPSAADRTNRLLAFGRLISYKRFDAAIEVAARLRRPLVIAGTGPDEARLRRLAAETRHADVTFAGRIADSEIRELYRTSAALLFFGIEDFGIIPVEAQACGLPVAASGAGGTLETVIDGATGAHAPGSSLQAFVDATERVLTSVSDPDACRANAERYSYAAFGDHASEWVSSALG